VGSSERKNYVGTLLKVLGAFSESSWLPGTTGILQGRAINMERRLKAMNKSKRKSILLGVCVTLGILFLGSVSVYAIQSRFAFNVTESTEAAGIGIAGDPASEQGKSVLRAGVVDRNGIELVRRLEDGKSFYPYHRLASHVIGFVDKNQLGTRGIERFIDKKHVADRKVVLTLDKKIQEITEKILDKAIADNKLKGGASAIVTDPVTGEILAMVSKPDYDPNAPLSAPQEIGETRWNSMLEGERDVYLRTVTWLNKAISMPIQPGSAFKAITAAAGLEEGVVQPESRVKDETVTVAFRKIYCWKPDTHGDESFAEGVYNSCNPVFVRVAQSLGTDRFFRYVRKFGFYEKTGLGFDEEASSRLPSYPSEIDRAMASFGQGLEVTPIQLVSAYGAIANGGELVLPQIVRGVTDGEGKDIMKFKPKRMDRILSEKTVQSLGTILEGVVSKGTGNNAYIRDYGIAGKTGTTETRIGDKFVYNALFAGFAPYDQPKIAFLLVCYDPGVEPHTGGMVAAPAAGELAREVLDYLAKQ
jgi:stage V sporulation protein D (sporulation-specific penicillin-binding protein)